MKLFLIGIMGMILMPLTLFAAEVDVEENVTIVLPSDGTSYTLTSDSMLTSFSVTGGTISFTMAGRHRVVLKSADRKILTNSLNVSPQCGNTESTLTLELGPDDPSQDVTVTPSGTCSGGGGGVGGGGGGGSSPSSSSSSSAVSSNTATTLTDLQKKLSDLLSQVPANTVATITKNLARGIGGDQVRSLQRILALDKDVYPEGVVNGTFGPLTQRAVGKFQEKHGIAKPGEPGYGTVGPKTRAKLNELAVGQAPSATPASTPETAAVSFLGSLKRTLTLGDSHGEISKLQSMLAKDATIYPEQIISGYFGSLTLKAVQRFQEKHGIAKPGEPGYGIVGPKTRAKLQEVFPD